MQPVQQKAALSLLALEPRVVFDGAIAPHSLDIIAHPEPQDVSPVADTLIAESLAVDWQAPLPVAAEEPHNTTEIAFIDGAIADTDALLAAISPDTKVFILDPAKDGIEQIAQILADESGISAIHILSHGSEGKLYLGTAELNVDSVGTIYADDLAVVRSALAPNADILVYGCDFALGTDGAQAMYALAAATDADVAASTDITGAASLGGDWELEATTGSIEAQLVVSPWAQQEWRHTLTVTATGSETLVNQITTGNQATVETSGKQIASDAIGNYVVVWQDNSSGVYEVYARKFAADGTPVTAAFQVSSTTTNAHETPSVAMDANGNFVVTWQSLGDDGSGYGIYAKRYNPNGTALGSEFLVNTYTTLDQKTPSIAMNVDGFVITWSSYGQDGSGYGIYGQRYNASGVAQGSEFLVNTHTNSDQFESAVAMNASGAFVVTWTSNMQDGSVKGVFGQRYNASGVAQGSEFQINTSTVNDQRWSDVAISTAGDFVVTWSSWPDITQDWTVMAQRYDASGAAQGTEFQVNTYTPLYQQNSTIAMDAASGRFVISWMSWMQDEPGVGWWGQYAQAYAADGTTDGSEFLVNTTTLNDQKYGDVTWGGHQIVVVWSGRGIGDVDGVFMQRYTASNTAPTITSGSTASVAENTTAVMTVTGNDADNDNLTYSISGGADAAKFTIDANSGALSFISAPNFEALADSNHDNVYEVTVQVSDGALTASQAVSVTVTNVNEAPSVTSPATATVLEYTLPVMTVSASDPDAGTTFTFSIAGGDDAIEFDIDANTGALSFLTGPDYEDPGDLNKDNVYEVTVQVSDGEFSATKAISVTVSDNAPPVFTSSSTANVTENTTTVMTVTIYDPDGHTPTYSITGGADAAKFTIDSSTGVLSFIAAPDYEYPTNVDGNNVYQVMVCATIGIITIEHPIAVTITNANEAPSVTSGATASVAENTTAVMTVTGSDPDAGATLTYAIAGGADAAKFTINANTGALSFVTAPDFETPGDTGGDNVYNVIVQVSDGDLTATKAVAVTVTNVSEAPLSSETPGQWGDDRDPWYLRDLGETLYMDAGASQMYAADALDLIALKPAFHPFEGTPQDHVMPWLSFAHWRKDIGGMNVTARAPAIEFVSEVDNRRLVLHARQSDDASGDYSELTFLLADGRPLPVWVSVLPDGCVIADFPEGTEHIDLKIIIHSDRQPETETVIRAYLPSGEIVVKPQGSSGKPEALDFIDQLKRSRKTRSIPDFW